MIVKLLTEHHLEFLSLKGGCTGSSKSTLVKMPHCWKSHALAHYYYIKLGKILSFSSQVIERKPSLQNKGKGLYYMKEILPM